MQTSSPLHRTQTDKPNRARFFTRRCSKYLQHKHAQQWQKELLFYVDMVYLH